MADIFSIIGDLPLTSTIVDAMIIANAKIREYSKPMLSISGGADSDIMLDMCWRLDSEKKISYKFVNTGIEYEATKQHIKFLEKNMILKFKKLRLLFRFPPVVNDTASLF